MRNVSYYLAAIAAFTMWGFFSLILRPLAHYAALDILFYRVFLSAGLMLGSVFVRPRVWKEDRRLLAALSGRDRRGVLFQLFGGGLFLTCNWFFFIYVVNNVSVKASAFAYLVCPVLTTVLAWAILKEYLSKGQWVAVLMSAAGCGILAFNHLLDLVYSMIIAFSYAFYLVSQRKNYGVDRFLLLSGQVIFSALLLLPFYPIYRGPVPQEARFYLTISFIAVFLTIIPLFLNLYALKQLKSSTVGVLLNINPLVGFVLALTVFGEKVDVQQVVAYGIIVLSVVGFNWFNPAIRTPAVSNSDRDSRGERV
jgi:chloramphenicol-sensitive protein RarD